MIGITIDNKNQSLPTPCELSVLQYIELYRNKEQISIYDYLRFFLNIDNDVFMNLPARSLDILSKRIFTELGMYETSEPPPFLVIGKRIIETKNINFDRVGVRLSFEKLNTTKELTDLERVIYYLACGLCEKDFDIDVIEANYKELLTCNALQTFTLSSFFLQNSLRNSRSIINSFTAYLKELCSKLVANFERK